jgi:hypothetical protein
MGSGETRIEPYRATAPRRPGGLPSPAFTLEQPLAHGTPDFWTVRARFELDGRERATGWGTVSFLASEWLTPPSEFSYRLETP